MNEVLMIGAAARALNVSEQTVRRWTDQGKLPSVRTSSGQRIFRQADVATLRRERDARESRGDHASAQ